jgi:hypothetical protein
LHNNNNSNSDSTFFTRLFHTRIPFLFLLQVPHMTLLLSVLAKMIY